MAKSTNTPSNQPQNNPDMIFPFKVDVKSRPERKWVRAEHLWVRVCVISAIINALLAVGFLFLTQHKNVIPFFMTFDQDRHTFELVKYDGSKATDTPALSQTDLLAHQFLTDYVIARNTLSATFADNDQRWCDCLHDERQKILIKKSIQRQVQPRCRVCLMSHKDVFTTFTEKQIPYFTKRLQNGDIRRVEILDIQKVTTIPAERGGPHDIYRVDFIRHNPTISNKASWTAYIGLRALEPKAIQDAMHPYLFTVISYGESPLIVKGGAL